LEGVYIIKKPLLLFRSTDVDIDISTDKLSVKQTYHESGKMATESYFNAQGKLQGVYKEWYPSGHLQGVKTYNNGELLTQKLLGKDGKVYQNIVYKDGREYGLLFSSFCLNGVSKDEKQDSIIFKSKN